ncbi:MAG: hypothetical protein IIZ25_02935 [Thermoguttaceae bacterium]|nr:hypothetical protein [Thermoguttaceae bacterium]
MQYKGYLAGALCLVGFVYFAGCDSPGSIETQDGTTLVYVTDLSRPTGPEERIVTVAAEKAAPPADQKQWAKRYDEAQKRAADAKKAAAQRAAAAAQKAAAPAADAPLAKPEDIKAVKDRVAALKGTVKTAKNGAITSIRLAASGGDNVTVDDMKLIARLGDLESVSFEGAVFTDEMIEPLTACQKLNSVTINNADITAAGLESLAKLPELTMLDIRRDLKLDNAALAVLASMPKLTELHAHYNSFTNSGMNKIAKAVTLKKVDVRGCSDVSDNGAKYLAKLPELEELQFRFSITNAGVEHLTAAQKLTFVEFQDCGDITDAAVPFFQQMPALKGLRIFRCKGFLDPAVAGVAALPLTRLELRDLNVSNEGIAALKNNTTIKTLELSELASVDAAGLTDALSGLKDLEKASFFSIPLNNDALAGLAANSPNLKSLQLRAVAVTDEAIDSVLKFKNLETLDLRENAGLTADALAKLGAMASLKTLYLKGTGITDKSGAAQLEALKKALPKCRIET